MRFTFIVLAASVLVGCSGTHTVFNDGASEYTIVVDSEASECDRYAADELQHWICEVSGVEIPVVADLNAGKRGKRLVVGYNALVKAEEPDGINDSFTYESRGGDVYFWGNTDRGTLYSVYSFLENELGCRWYNSRTSLIPKRESLTFGKLSHSEAPAIRMRNDFYWDVNTHPEFAVRLRSNSTHSSNWPAKFGGSETYWSCHTLPGFIASGGSFEECPEHYGMLDGKRTPAAQPCLSNPEVLKIAIDRTRKVMRENPENLIYSVSQGDGMGFCQCDSCRAIEAKYGNRKSGILLWFINQVADAVKDEFPDKYVGTFAYQESRPFPENIVPRDNVVIRLCPIEECQIHDYDSCEKNRDFLSDLEGWGRIAKHLYIWDYNTSFSNYILPVPNVWTFQNRIRHFRDAHAIGIMPEGSYQSVNSAFEDMKAYVLAKLMWNPDCDVDAVIKDFTDGFFGPSAGPIIREYLDFERKSLIWDDNHEDLYLSDGADMYKDEFILPARKYFTRAKEAVRAAGGDMVEEYINRIEYAEISVCCLEMFRMPEQGRSDGALDILKRVIERENIRIWAEFGDETRIEDLLRIIDK